MAGTLKQQTVTGYSVDHTQICEQVLVTLLNAFGTLKDTLRLVGGLVPRYLTPEMPPSTPAHFGTSDVDIVLNLEVIAEGEGYASLSRQLEERGFIRYTQENGWQSAWRWMYPLSGNTYVLVEFLQGGIHHPAGKAVLIDEEGVAALVIPHAEMTHEWYCEKQIGAELLNGRGFAVENIKFANVVSFILLKALSFDGRNEPKDAADLIFVMKYAGTPEYIAEQFIQHIKTGKYPKAINAGLDALKRKFAEGNDDCEGYRLTGPVCYGQFLYGNSSEHLDARILEQRFATGLVTEVLELINRGLIKND